MTDDISAVAGERGGYVPCDEVALTPPASAQDGVAVYGEDAGFVAFATAAASDVTDSTDTSAVFGRATGYVPGPCIDCTSLLNSVPWNNMDVGGGGTSWTGTRLDRTGAGSFARQTAGSQTSGSGWATLFPATPSHTETEGRGYASVNVTALAGPGATHVTLHATLRNWISFIHEAYIIGNEADVDWELVAGAWGTGTPIWDDGLVVASGTIPASTASFDVDGLLVVPIETTSFSVTWPITGDYAQWYFRVVSANGYRYSNGSPANGHPFTDAVIDVRYPSETFEDTHSPQWWESLRSYISLMPLTSSSFEDWTLDVLQCT